MSLAVTNPVSVFRRAQQLITERSSARGAPLVVWAAIDESAEHFASRLEALRRNWSGRTIVVCPDGYLTPNGVQRAELPEKAFHTLHPSRAARYRVLRGGRGAGKSWSIARVLVLTALSTRARILCCREIQRSIRESTHRLLADQIDAMRLGAFFTVGMQTITGHNGSEFIFEGLYSNQSKLKSIEGCTLAWTEEAAGISAASWEILTPTIRSPASEIWVNYNPVDATDPTHQRFTVAPPPDAIVESMTWVDNPWWPAELENERQWMLRTDPDAHTHVYEGQCRLHSNAAVLHGKWRSEAFEPGADWDDALFGVDYGYSQDPSTMVKLWVHERTLYVEHEAYGIGVDIDQLPRLFDTVPGARAAIIRADSARPETTAFLQQHGYRGVRSCEKWPGSVEDGVAHVRSYEQIVIHPRCEHAIQEARLWSYKTDRRTGEITPDLIGKHDHIWDAARYALGPLIKRPGGSGILEYYRAELQKMGRPTPQPTEQAQALSAPVPAQSEPAQGQPLPPPPYIPGESLIGRARRMGGVVREL